MFALPLTAYTQGLTPVGSPAATLIVTPALPARGASLPDPAESAQPIAEVIDGYVREGLRTNLELRRQSLDVERSFAALDEARARMVPEVALAASYERAQGGRTLDLPVGELLNPVYGTLNQLLAAAARPAEFAPIANESVPYLYERNQDTRLTLRQPLFAPGLPAAVRAERAAVESSEFARLALGRRLKRDITVGYLDWMRATKGVAIVESSRALLAENLRVNESLFRNGRVTEDQVLRARAELLAVDQQLREAENTRRQAQSYLNFLLNRDLSNAIEPGDPGDEVRKASGDLEALRAAALMNRPEIGQLDSALRASDAQIRVAQARLWPTLSLGVDGGIQGERYGFGSGRNFGVISLLLDWKLFDGGGDQARVREARAVARQAANERNLVARQIQLEVQTALDRLETTSDSLATAAARADAAHAAFRIASRKRDEGVISQVEFIDARSTLSGAELNLNSTRFELLSRQAELDYATAAGELPVEFAAR